MLVIKPKRKSPHGKFGEDGTKKLKCNLRKKCENVRWIEVAKHTVQ
jgi:hypothetical protein